MFMCEYFYILLCLPSHAHCAYIFARQLSFSSISLCSTHKYRQIQGIQCRLLLQINFNFMWIITDTSLMKCIVKYRNGSFHLVNRARNVYVFSVMFNYSANYMEICLPCFFRSFGKIVFKNKFIMEKFVELQIIKKGIWRKARKIFQRWVKNGPMKSKRFNFIIDWKDRNKERRAK